ncbi:MAG: HD domain-containing protein [Eubacterium sp.]|nr:HD domain-containing protein [Eubacterium sp.]
MHDETDIRMARYFGALIENRGVIANQHASRVGMITYVLAEKLMSLFPEYELTESRVRMIASAASLHDVGKLKVSDSIINKASRMTDQEYEAYQSHTYKGKKMFLDISKNIPDGDPDKEFFELCASICMSHHEKYGGDGYPEGLKGDDIPIEAQLVGLADMYDDAVSDRMYKRAIPKLEAFEMIRNGEMGTISPKLLQVFDECRSSLEEIINKDEKNNNK